MGNLFKRPHRAERSLERNCLDFRARRVGFGSLKEEGEGEREPASKGARERTFINIDIEPPIPPPGGYYNSMM